MDDGDVPMISYEAGDAVSEESKHVSNVETVSISSSLIGQDGQSTENGNGESGPGGKDSYYSGSEGTPSAGGTPDVPKKESAGGATPLPSSDTPHQGFADTPVYQGGGNNTPSHCMTPSRTPAHQNQTEAEGFDTSSDEDEPQKMNESYHNPEPPVDLKQDLIEADNIGETVFSKHWLFTTLMSLIQVIEGHEQAKEGYKETDQGIDISDELQTELCELWDMSMSAAVVGFLLDYKAVDLFTGVIAKSKAPRATEICVGILGNMACTEEAAIRMTQNDKLVKLMLLLLNDHDAPTLVEATRLMSASIAHVTAREPWLQAIHEDTMTVTNLLFIMSSSTNVELLHNAAELVDNVMDVDEGICEAWSTEDMLQGVLEACKQVGAHPCETLDCLLHILQLVSTSEAGVEALVNLGEPVTSLLMRNLTSKCSDEIVGVEGREHSFASVFSVLNVIFCSWDKGAELIVQDYQIVRCLLKVLEVVYPKLHKNHRKANKCRRRTLSNVSLSPAGHASQPSQDQSAENKAQENNGDSDMSSVSSSSSHEDDCNSEDNPSTVMLYEIVQGLAVDVLAALKQNTEFENGGADASSTDRLPSPARTLIYLDKSCTRERIYYLIYTLQDVKPADQNGITGSQESQSGSQSTGSGSGGVASSDNGTDHVISERADHVTSIEAGHVANHVTDYVTDHVSDHVSDLKNISERLHLDRLSRIIDDALALR